MNKKYILFDLDGTLTDSMLGITKSVQYALKKFNIEVTNLNDLCKFIGPPLKESFMEFYNFSEEDAEKGINFYREYFADKGIFENEPYGNIDKLLKSLKENDKTLLLATSKPEPYAIRIMEHFNLSQYFDFMAGSTLDGSRSKKSAVISYVLKENNLTNLSEIVMIGDRKHDILGAKENKIDSIGVLYGYGDFNELSSAGANFIAKDIAELKKILLGQ